MLYHYQAKDSLGRTVSGTVESDDQASAAHQVRSQGFYPMSIVPGGGVAEMPRPHQRAIPGTSDGPPPATVNRKLGGRFHRINKLDKAYMYRQLGALANAGISPERALEMVLGQAVNPAFRQVFSEMRGIVASGIPVSSAMHCYPKVFPEFERTLVRAGEMTGDVTDVYNRIADSLEREVATSRLILRESLLPSITLVCAFLLPPLYILIAYGDLAGYLRAAILPLGICVLAVYLTSVFIEEFREWRIGYDTALAKTPPFAGCAQALAVGRFARTLAALYSAGVLLPTAVVLAAKACGNQYIGNGLARAANSLEQGVPIIESLNRTNMLPPMVIGMLGTAEITGNLDSLMFKVADYFDAEAEAKIHRVAVIIGVIVLLAVGIYVGYIVIRFYTGYFGNMLNGANG